MTQVLRVPWFEWNEQWAADEKCDYLATVLYSGAGLTVKDAAVVPGAASATSRVEASTRSFDRSRRGNAPIFNDDPAEGATRDANADANASDGRRSSPSASSSSSSSSIFDDDFAKRSSDEDANSDYYSSSSSSDYSSSLGLGGVASFVARARAESDVSVHFSGSGGLVVEDVGSDEEELKLRNARKGDRLREREGGKLAYEGAWVGGDGAAQTPEAGGGDEEKTTRNQANAEAARHSTTRSFDPKLRKTDVAPYGMSMEPGGGRAVTRRRTGGSAAGEERRRARGRGGVSRRGERVSEKGEYGDDAADAFDAAPEAPPKVSKVGPKVSKASTTRASARVVRGGQSGASVGRASPVRRRRVRVSAPGAASRALGRASPARETGPGVASDAGGTRSDPKDLRKRSDARSDARSDGRPPETRFSSDARGDDEPPAALASSSSASSSPVSSLRGVGPVSAAALGEAGVRTVGELAGLSDADVAEIANSRKRKEGGDDEKKKGSAPLRRERLAGLRNLAADVVRASEDDE